MAFAANVSKPETISPPGRVHRTVELKEHLTKAMNVGDGTAKNQDYMGCRPRPEEPCNGAVGAGALW